MTALTIGADSHATGPAQIDSSIPLTVTSSKTLVPGVDRLVMADPSSGNMILTLPGAAASDGVCFYVKRVTNGSNTVLLVADGSDTIDNLANVSLDKINEFTEVFSDGSTAWRLRTLVRPSILGANRTEVFEASDLPAPVGGVITLPAGTYDFKDSMTLSDRLVTATNAIVSITINDSGLAPVITYTGTDPFLSVDGAGSGWIINGLSVSLTQNNVKFFDVTDCLLVQGIGMFISWAGTGGDIGLVHGATLATSFNTCVFSNFGTGIVVEETPIFTMKEMSMITDFSGGTTILTVNDGTLIGNMTIDTFSVTAAASDSIFCIDPSFLGGASITRVTNSLGANFFKTGTTGTFSAVADASFASESIASVTDSSGIARFNFSAPPTLFVGQEVTIAGYSTNTDYNITGTITATGTGYFEISSIAFGTNEAGGGFTSNTVTITSTSHGLSELTKLTLSTTLSIDYDGGVQIYNALTNTFQVNKAFTSTNTGTWDTSGLDQSSPHVVAFDNFGQSPSSVHVSGASNGNSSATSTTDGVYSAIDVTGFADDSEITERFKLTDEDVGIYTFTGLEKRKTTLSAKIWATKTGSTEDYRFAVSVNGALPVFASATYGPIEVKTTKVLTAIDFPVILDAGDTVQVMIAGDGTADSITITDILVSSS